MALDISQLFGMETREPPGKDKVSLAVLLRFLTALLEREEDDEETERPREEVPVRPRVEPLGGA